MCVLLAIVPPLVTLIPLRGYGIPKDLQDKVFKFTYEGQPIELRHGSVVIVAIINCCTNISNMQI